MAPSSNTKSDTVKRCAVCKIDLKGRFVYIDDEIEKLFGIPREDLFGKPIQDFICNNSRQVIELLFSQRNSYETCYDTINLNIKNGNNNNNMMAQVSAVASLNLVSGNPVNYILIFTSIGKELNDSSNLIINNEYDDKLKAILQVDGSFDLKENLEYIHKFTNVKQICLYFVNGDKLEPRYFLDRDNQKFSTSIISEPGQLHYRVVSTGEPYDFTEIEDKNSPNEYICLMNFKNSEKVLLRFIFDEIYELEINKENVDRVKISVLLLERLYSVSLEKEIKQEENIDIRFIVGLLDSMDIGAVLTDFNGEIIGFNGRIKDLLGLPEVTGNIHEFLKIISKKNDTTIDTVLIDNFLNSFDSSEINKSRIQLPSGEFSMVTSLRLGETLDDLSSLVAFVPCYTDEVQQMPEDSQLWIDTIKAADKILSNSSKKETMAFIGGFIKMLDAFEKSNEPQKVDLNVLVNDVFKKVKASSSKKKIISRIESLPILTIPEEKISLILEELFKNSIEYNDNFQPILSVRADMIAETCCLTISDNGRGMSKEDLQSLNNIIEKVESGNNVKKFSTGLARVNYLLKSIEGRIDITSSRSEGTTVTISFPFTAMSSDFYTKPDEFLVNKSISLESSQVN
ncbi:MAG: ATP-binding protein [bacterium]